MLTKKKAWRLPVAAPFTAGDEASPTGGRGWAIACVSEAAAIAAAISAATGRRHAFFLVNMNLSFEIGTNLV